MTTVPVERDVPFPDDAVEVGRVLGAWGVKGWFKVQSFSSDPQALYSTKRWFVHHRGPRAPMPSMLRIIETRDQSGLVVASAHEVTDRDAAHALRGAGVYVSRASFPTPADGEHYWVDLIGLRVLNREGDALGEVIGLMDTGAHSVLRVRPPQHQGLPGSAERLIPFVAAYIDEVDVPERRIVVDWGLDY